MVLPTFIKKAYDAVVPDEVKDFGEALGEKMGDSVLEITESAIEPDGAAALRLVTSLKSDELTRGIFRQNFWMESLLDTGAGFGINGDRPMINPEVAFERTCPEAYYAIKAATAFSGKSVFERMADAASRSVVKATRPLHPDAATPTKLENPEILTAEAINSLLAESATGGKIKNLKVELGSGSATVTGDYATFLGTVGFTIELSFSITDAKVSGGIRSVEAVGLDLKGILQDQILSQFSKHGIEVPEAADLNDLSWLKIPGITNLEIHPDKILLNRETA